MSAEETPSGWWSRPERATCAACGWQGALRNTAEPIEQQFLKRDAAAHVCLKPRHRAGRHLPQSSRVDGSPWTVEHTSRGLVLLRYRRVAQWSR